MLLGRIHPVAAVPVVVVGLLLSNCAAGGSLGGGLTVLSVTPPRSLGVGQSVVLTAGSYAGMPLTPAWTLYGPATNSVGTLAGQAGNNISYTAPAVPPIYTNATFQVPQGAVEVQVSDTTGGQAATFAEIVITAPMISVAISPTVTSVLRGGPVYFTGYAVGSVNTAVVW